MKATTKTHGKALSHHAAAWTDGQDERSIFWLSGIAGTEKSTIDRIIAHSYCNKGRLRVSFFSLFFSFFLFVFERWCGDTGHAGKFFSSTASQLTSQSDILQSHICDVSRMGHGFNHRNFSVHWANLILVQLYKLRDISPSLLLVVDVLDKCDAYHDIEVVLECLSGLDTMAISRLRVLVTSRLELAIPFCGPWEPGCSEPRTCPLRNASTCIVNNDISIFFHEEFR